MVLSEVEREITKNVVQRFLHENKPSPRRLLIRRFKSSQSFHRLTGWSVIANVAANVSTDQEEYLPRALAFYYADDPEALRLARQSVSIVSRSLQRLFHGELDKTQFTPGDLKAQADKTFNIPPGQDMLKLGLYLVHDIGILTLWSPASAIEPELFSIAEHIVEIGDPDKVWDDFIARSAPHDAPRQPAITPIDSEGARFITGDLFGSAAQFRVEGELKDSSRENAEKDDLLPVLRRRVFDQDLVALSSSASKAEPVSLLMLDLDHFKAVNDTHGHPIGDEVLIDSANAIARRCRHKGKVYRVGGEEIAVLLPNFTVPEAVALAESIRSEIETSKMSSKKLSITASIGVATAPVHATESKQLLEVADQALYTAKHFGRNLVRIAGEDRKTPTSDSQRKVVSTVPGQPVEVTLSHQRLVCTAEHHNYRLTVTLKNMSATVIDSYHVDVFFPTGLLQEGVTYALELPSRHTATHSLFRVATETGQVNTLYPGDAATTMTIDYCVDREMFHHHHEWLQQNVTAILYVKGGPPLSVERAISEMQEF